MNFYIKRQEKYSRGELLLRAFFGWLYIFIPHYFVMIFYVIGLMFVRIGVFFTILFTGKFPKGMFDYIVKVLQYMTRLNARIYNMADDYPPFSLDAIDPNIVYQMPYVENISRGRLLVRHIFGAFMLIPHLFVLFFMIIGALFVHFIAFWAVLFTGNYPEGMYNYMERLFRWNMRVSNYLYFYTDEYPPFHGNALPSENINTNVTSDHLVTEE